MAVVSGGLVLVEEGSEMRVIGDVKDSHAGGGVIGYVWHLFILCALPRVCTSTYIFDFWDNVVFFLRTFQVFY